MDDLIDLSELINLGNALKPNDIEKLSNVLKIPKEQTKKIKSGIAFMYMLQKWDSHNPYTFYKALKSIRPDLAPNSTQFKWLAIDGSQFDELPNEIRSQGHKFVEQYKNACLEGTIEMNYFKLIIVGPEGVGKTSLLKALRNQKFEEEESSTDFIEKTDITISELNNAWDENVDFKDRLKETRDEVIAHDVVDRFKSITDRPHDKLTPEFIVDESPKSVEFQSKHLKLNQPEEELHSGLAESHSQLKRESSEIIQNQFESLSLNPGGIPIDRIQKHWRGEEPLDPIEFFTVWDLAGQLYLFCMHSMFLSPRAVYLLPVDLSVSLDAKVTLRTRDKGRLDRREMKDKTYIEIIKHWVQTIYSVSTSGKDQCHSRIIIVFTKSDKVPNPKDLGKKFFKRIKDALGKNDCYINIINQKYHVLSSKDRKIEKFNDLRKSICEQTGCTRFENELPIRWLDFALKIILHKNSVIDQKEIHEIAISTGCMDECTEILQLFHSIGLFFVRNNILIKSLPNILDTVSSIISYNKSDGIKEIEGKQTESHKDERILTDEALNLILERNGFSKMKPEIVRLLTEYGVLMSSQENSSEFHIPFLLTGDLSSIYTPEQNDKIFYLFFPDKLIPTSFYFAFISHCISKSTNFSESIANKPIFGFDCLKFQWEEYVSWIIDFTKHQPYIRIILQVNYTKHVPNFYSILYQLEESIVKIQRKLILCERFAEITLDCPCGSFPQTLKPCISFNDLRRKSVDNEKFYCECKKKHYPWSSFKTQLNPFEDICSDLGQRFLEEYQDEIINKLDLSPILDDLYKKGFIYIEDIHEINSLDNTVKANFVLKKFINLQKKWPDLFYKCLKSNIENDDLKNLFESFIIKSVYSDASQIFSYPFNHNPHGICLIINIQNFDDKPERTGSEVDVEHLKETFEILKFSIYTSGDKVTKSDFIKLLDDVSSMDHENFDAFFCIIMSHGGDDDVICTSDGEVITQDLIIDKFKPDKCEGLGGKPKIFIMQACRGGKEDEGVTLENSEPLPDTNIFNPDRDIDITGDDANEDSVSPSHVGKKKVHTCSDIYIAQATMTGHRAYRSKKEGSIFIYTLCSSLKSLRSQYHFLEIMCEVRRQVANEDIGGHIQLPQDTQTLMKQFFLL